MQVKAPGVVDRQRLVDVAARVDVGTHGTLDRHAEDVLLVCNRKGASAAAEYSTILHHFQFVSEPLDG